jgi:hypothetical protein
MEPGKALKRVLSWTICLISGTITRTLPDSRNYHQDTSSPKTANCLHRNTCLTQCPVSSAQQSSLLWFEDSFYLLPTAILQSELASFIVMQKWQWTYKTLHVVFHLSVIKLASPLFLGHARRSPTLSCHSQCMCVSDCNPRKRFTSIILFDFDSPGFHKSQRSLCWDFIP